MRRAGSEERAKGEVANWSDCCDCMFGFVDRKLLVVLKLDCCVIVEITCCELETAGRFRRFFPFLYLL